MIQDQMASLIGTYPTETLTVDVNLSVGKNQIFRSLDRFNNLYFPDSHQMMTSVHVELAIGGSYEPPANQEVAVSVISANKPVNITLISMNNQVVQIKSRLFIMDDFVRIHIDALEDETEVTVNSIVSVV